MKNQFWSILLIIGLIQSIHCDGDREIDPCKDMQPVTAAFTIHESFALGYRPEWEIYDTDTVRSIYVTFTAMEDEAEYEWTLGAETITEKSFTRSDFPRGQNIEVKLKVTKNPNLACFPEDDGKDSLTRIFYVTPSWDNSLFQDEFEGFHTDKPQQKFTIIIDDYYRIKNDPVDQSFIRIINLVNNCDIIGFAIQERAYKENYFKDGGAVECLNPIGIMRISGPRNDSIKIKYTIKKAPDDFINRVPKTFIGIRK
jgi:hypothetical protein